MSFEAVPASSIRIQIPVLGAPQQMAAGRLVRRIPAVRALLRAEGTRFLLVAGPGPERIPEAMYFLRKLQEAGHRLGPVVVNRVHPEVEGGDAAGLELLRHLGERDRRGLEEFRSRFPKGGEVLDLPLQPRPPSGLADLESLGETLLGRLRS